MVTLSDLSTAADERQAVCLSCGTIQEPQAIPDEGCSECGEFPVVAASLILQCARFVAGLLEGE